MICKMLLLFILCFCLFSTYNAETDTLKQGALVRDWENLTSANGIFKLAFFTLSSDSYPTTSTNHYLGIFYAEVPYNPVWVGNREAPVRDSSGALIVDTDGLLKISYLGGSITISNHSRTKNNISYNNNISATLLDSGNLVLRESFGNGSFGPTLWQSFDYPTNCLIPGMKLGVNLKTGHRWTLTSWVSDTFPSPGAFELGLDPNGANQLIISRRGEVYWKSGAWNDRNGSFENTPDITQTSYGFRFKLVSNEKEKFFSYYEKHEEYTSARWELDTLGQIMQFYRMLNVNTSSWNWRYAADCVSPYESAVCLKEKPIACRKKTDVFVKTRGYFTDGQPSYVYEGMGTVTAGLSDCNTICWNNCSCTAYESATTDGIGCILWTNTSKFIVDASSDLSKYVLNHDISKV